MWMQFVIGVGGLVLFALLFGTFHVVANRVRELGGECRMDSVRCLGCVATGRCRSLAAPSGKADAGRR